MHAWHDISAQISAVTNAHFTVKESRSIGGGCINQTYCITDGAQRFFAKLNTPDNLSMFEAEAAGLQGTGIGCYFDDAVHDALGLDTARFQDFYHFTVGQAVIDARLGSEPAYAHLAGDARRRI